MSTNVLIESLSGLEILPLSLTGVITALLLGHGTYLEFWP